MNRQNEPSVSLPDVPEFGSPVRWDSLKPLAQLVFHGNVGTALARPPEQS